MENIELFKEITLDRRPDVIKFVPPSNLYAVVGTYTLLDDDYAETDEAASQQRVGSLNLILVQNDTM